MKYGAAFNFVLFIKRMYVCHRFYRLYRPTLL